jgi:AcrR family transcriptional regulator
MATSTRDRLAAAAASLLDEGGPDAVTLREVGRLAGVSHNAPYKHFADKTALLAEIATRQLQSLTRQLERAVRRAPSDVAAMQAVAVVYVRWASRHPERFKLTFSRLGSDDPDLATAATSARLAFFRPFANAAHQGALAIDPERASLLAWTIAHGAVDLDLNGHLRKDGARTTPQQLVTDLVALLTAARSSPLVAE